MTVQELGRRVHDDIGPQFQRPLRPRAGKGVIDDDKDVPVRDNLDHLLDINEL